LLSFLRIVSLVAFQPVAEVAQHAGGCRQVSDLQPGGELVDPAGLPLVDRGVLLAAELGEPDQRGAAVIEVVAGFALPLPAPASAPR